MSSLPVRRSPFVVFVVAAMEAVLLLLVCLSPWAYGCVHPGFEFLLDIGIALLLALWAARILAEGQITWKKSGAALCLAGLFLLGMWQRTPLPPSVLAWLSPGAKQCYDELLANKPEVLPPPGAGEAPVSAASLHSGPPAGSTLSLYPNATRQDSLRILAVFLVFVVVLNNLASRRVLFRLAVAALANGVLLSLFALAQFFSAPQHTVYWTYPALGKVFGPFINQNHFPDYVNFCIGLGIGLLIRENIRSHASASSEEENSFMQTLHNPRALWICAALVLMLTAVAFSLSRGGMLALVGAMVLCGALGWRQIGHSLRLGSLLLVFGAVLALSAWFGIGLLEERLATLGSGDALEDRSSLWLRSLPIVGDFPVWGTGYGTFGYIEPMYRKEIPYGKILPFYTRAHNDYLDILVEGGIVGLALLLAALALVYRQGYLALIRNRGHSEVGLTLGALLGLTALVLHSVGEFGAHTPAITLFATVICAHLCGLGQTKRHARTSAARESFDDAANDPESNGDGKEYRLRLGGLAPVLGAVTALGFGLVLCGSGWKAHRIDRLRNAALRMSNTDIDQARLRIDALSAAASLAPDDARIQEALGFTHSEMAALLMSNKPPDHRSANTQSLLALQHYLQARDACPLVSAAQLGIASYSKLLEQGDTDEDYIRRVKLLAPVDAKMWFRCGILQFQRNKIDAASATWRHCLELSDEQLLPILVLAKRLKTDQLIEKVLPDDPELLLASALHLYPNAGSVKQRRPFLNKALHLLEAKAQTGLTPQDLHVKAQVYRAFEQPDQAIQAYRKLLERAPAQIKWRFEFAIYLFELRRWEESHSELVIVLAQNPKHQDARDHLNAAVQQMGQRKRQTR